MTLFSHLCGLPKILFSLKKTQKTPQTKPCFLINTSQDSKEFGPNCNAQDKSWSKQPSPTYQRILDKSWSKQPFRTYQHILDNHIKYQSQQFHAKSWCFIKSS